MPNPLYRNDRPATYPESCYAASTPIPPERPGLRGAQRADVCVVGAGFCGLTAALHLAQAGLSVIVLDAHRVGWGASGRNGGQVGTGFNKDMRWLRARVGEGPARALWDMTEEAKQLLRDLAAAHAPDAPFKPGVAHGAYSVAEAAALHDAAEDLARTYGYDRIEPLAAQPFQRVVKSPRYRGGVIDRGAGHIHPLRYALGLARAVEKAGAVIHERSEVLDLGPGRPAELHTGSGRVTADHVLLAGNGYLTNLTGRIAARTMPLNSFMAATEPLGDRAAQVLAEDIACADSKFVVNYFRLSEDKRLLFGGCENYSLAFPQKVEPQLRKRMEAMFPQLGGVGITHTWGGTLGITMTRLPLVTRAGEGVLSAGGFSGHGVALAGLAGKLMAEAVQGRAGRFDTFAALPVPPFPGGAALRAPLLTLAMTWYALRDRLGL
ncbi:MAG: FAD-binding oxidoreductase [Salibaculum sp.]|uniref:NAD(P)/FAD-dependent oxidoreductase n=1 Tax=Salibaculum sp. TaxID=2855480 RepID=UPI00287054D0|nr:FAD-binding oxidoreductase [Salibaculum sp.]MDR9427236.1 FAD-binding oxidoreductase [Salibaculum sp.]MDR9482668.1 FAD-binding oxidoreductase [Salibaculum sp.]